MPRPLPQSAAPHTETSPSYCAACCSRWCCLHSGLCCLQCCRWHSAPQYAARWHAEHSRSGGPSSARLPQPAHRWLLLPSSAAAAPSPTSSCSSKAGW